MGRIKQTGTSKEYNTVADAGLGFNEINDCAVRAVSLVTGVTYAAAHAKLAELGRKPKQGTPVFAIHKAINFFGKTLVEVKPEEFIRQYTGNHRGLRSVTTHHTCRFPKVWKDGHTYLAYTIRMGHVLAIVDGVTHDWTVSKAKRISRIYRVLDIVGPVAEPA